MSVKNTRVLAGQAAHIFSASGSPVMLSSTRTALEMEHTHSPGAQPVGRLVRQEYQAGMGGNTHTACLWAY